MAIPYRYVDFAPSVAQGKFVGITVDVQFESLPDTVVRANEWITRTGVRVVNIETVILPVPRSQPDYPTGENGFRYDQLLVQVVRVWYTKED
jgi:hypothetical protein